MAKHNGFLSQDVRPDGSLRSVWEGGEYVPGGQWHWLDWTITKVYGGYRLSHDGEPVANEASDFDRPFRFFGDAAKIAESMEASRR